MRAKRWGVAKVMREAPDGWIDDVRVEVEFLRGGEVNREVWPKGWTGQELTEDEVANAWEMVESETQAGWDDKEKERREER